MPEASVDKNSNFLLWKCRIGFADNACNVLLPSADPRSCKHGEKPSFKLCTPAFNGLHGAFSVIRFEVVAHAIKIQLDDIATFLPVDSKRF